LGSSTSIQACKWEFCQAHTKLECIPCKRAKMFAVMKHKF
jgi:hypothetical protein